MSDLYVSWEEYHRLIERLAVQIDRSGWQFDQIVCLAKGGLRVGDLLCRLFRQPLAILYASSYGGTNNQLRGELKISSNLAMTTETLGKRVLLVDDLADSGITLEKSLRWIEERHSIDEIRSAVIWCKGASVIKPDYYVEFLPDNPWIHQPFERYERITPKDLEVGE
ncbi:phosphoribosyltransferase [Pannus brasiliensis CCIBt3594]|uniref:Phosphoribosyltransferase n=1 Tax=Pannus brasiliensis CCIBt3594 TaxID=1427578 RepID=A0AAW9QMT8_9CHRO